MYKKYGYVPAIVPTMSANVLIAAAKQFDKKSPLFQASSAVLSAWRHVRFRCPLLAPRRPPSRKAGPFCELCHYFLLCLFFGGVVVFDGDQETMFENCCVMFTVRFNYQHYFDTSKKVTSILYNYVMSIYGIQLKISSF